MSINAKSVKLIGLALFAGIFALPAASASAQSLSFFSVPLQPLAEYAPPQSAMPQYASQEQQSGQQSGDVATDEMPAQFRRQIVSYSGSEAAGTIIVDTPHTYLYLVLGEGKAMRYGIGVGRQGFTWSGTQNIVRKAEWPDWIPPAEMVARQPYLPRWVGGGPGNPLGARAMYLGNTDYRIHGTNDPTTIGKHVSSGCIRMENSDVIDLYQRVGVGTKVVVLPNDSRAAIEGNKRVAVQ